MKEWREAKKSKDEGYSINIFEAPRKSDIWLPSTWKAANPSLAEGESISKMAAYERAAKAARKDKLSELDFRRRFLGQHVSRSHFLWISGDRFKFHDCQKFGSITLGLDSALSRDRTAYTITEQVGEKYYFRTRYVLPEGALEEMRKEKKDLTLRWASEGWIKIQKGRAALDLADLRDDLLAILRQSECLDIRYDPGSGANILFKELEAEGYKSQPMRGYPRYVSPCLNFIEAIYEGGNFLWDGSPVLKSDFQNALVTSKQSRNYRGIARSSVQDSIDGCISCLWSLPYWIEAERKGRLELFCG